MLVGQLRVSSTGHRVVCLVSARASQLSVQLEIIKEALDLVVLGSLPNTSVQKSSRQFVKVQPRK